LICSAIATLEEVIRSFSFKHPFLYRHVVDVPIVLQRKSEYSCFEPPNMTKDWDIVQPSIKKLSVDEKKSLQDVKSIMEKRHNFRAS
jgi:hypothetical protein